ncbi:hypothetical protein FF1_019254 [Malus domestica]
MLKKTDHLVKPISDAKMRTYQTKALATKDSIGKGEEDIGFRLGAGSKSACMWFVERTKGRRDQRKGVVSALNAGWGGPVVDMVVEARVVFVAMVVGMEIKTILLL